MLRIVLSIIGLIILLAPVACPQEILITDFPLGVGGTINPDFFKPYYPQLQVLADTLQKYSLARAVIVGSADGTRYESDNDAKNPGLALGRAHVLRNLLITEFHVDSTQLLIQSTDVHAQGGQYRFVSIRVDRELEEMDTRLDTLAQQPIVQRPITEVREITNYLTENMGLRLSAGVSSSPFGGIPIVTGAVVWKKAVFIEGVVGHTFWSNSYRFEGASLDTWRRMAGGQLTIYPWKRTAVGIVGGWIRVEEISQKYYAFVKLSEGPVLGVRVTPHRHATITGLYNPARHRVAGDRISKPKNGQFIVTITLHVDVGGGK
ncbi:MAG TPA: hypothetical protein VN285_11805 [Candidatus Deferrimicrobium sp.]|nr:hypothetical protein [Candidatus Deferrimicrobium sp.]